MLRMGDLGSEKDRVQQFRLWLGRHFDLRHGFHL